MKRFFTFFFLAGLLVGFVLYDYLLDKELDTVLFPEADSYETDEQYSMRIARNEKGASRG